MRRLEKAPKVICSVVGFLGLVAAALAIAAEATRIKVSQTVPTFSGCIYPSSPASGLGLAAALVLTVAQIIISITTGCLCCRRQSYQSNSSKRLAIVFFVISWITFVHAFLILLAAAAVNSDPEYNSYSAYSGTNSCRFVGAGVFAGAAVLSIATVVLGIAYYLAWDSAKMGNTNSWNGTAAAPNQGGIAMGHPQFPPPPQYPQQQNPPPPQYPQQQYTPPPYPPKNEEGPVFVHEDTYMRRQFT